MPGKMEFEFRFGSGGGQGAIPRDADTPMRILLLGDFSGRESRGIVETGDRLASRPILRVDVDTLETVMARVAPRLELALGPPDAPLVPVEFKHLEDFHPDSLYQRISLFQPLAEIRRRLLDPGTSARMIAELSAAGQTGPLPPESPAPAASEQDQETLHRLLGGRPATAGRPPTAIGGQTVDISRFVEAVVAPHITRGPDPMQAELVASVDRAASMVMRALLHHPLFQGLEAAWGGAQMMVSRLELGETLKLYLLDVSRQELAADLRAAGADLDRSGLYRLLVEKEAGTPGGEPWSLLAGCYSFGPSADDVETLAAIGAIASQAGGPFLAAADPRVLGADSAPALSDPGAWVPLDAETKQRWQALRRSEPASWIGLALPRVLLRLPYGEGSDPIEAFVFTELDPLRDHEAFLWGSPAVACALMIGQGFQESGYGMEPGDVNHLDDLPAHSHGEEDNIRMTPCAEVILSEKAWQAILARGFIPMLSVRDANRVVVARFQSIADPSEPLAGPWGVS